MHKTKMWNIDRFEEEKVKTLTDEAKITSLLAKVFLSRGITDPNYINNFLSPSLKDIHDPFLLNDMNKATDRILRAISNNEKIIIYGDYDVDGVTSTSCLYLFLKSLNVNVSFFIPDRVEDGYGLSKSALDKVFIFEPNLIITVDCGIVSFDEVLYSSSKNIDIIVTDHHECRETLPEAIATINPHRHDSTYPYPDLAGVGVTFKLIHALCIELNLEDRYLNYLDIVTVGTIADVVPLEGENRTIVSIGLQKLQDTQNIGLKALIHASGLNDKELTSYSVAFLLAPRINAAGRLGDATLAVELLTTQKPLEAQKIADELNSQNKVRQDTELEILEKALFQIESDPDYRDEPIIVVNGKGWHHGVIGIVSSRITDKYYKPSIVICEDDSMAKASARSIPEFNMHEALDNVSDLLLKFGGHKMAAGLSLDPANIQEFRKSINLYAKKLLTSYDLTPKIQIDASLDPQDLTLNAVKELEKLSPFGQNNPKPMFCAYGFDPIDIRQVGGNKHLKIRFSKDGKEFDSIAFGMGELSESLQKNTSLDIAFYPDINVWNGNEKVQFIIKDIRENLSSTIKKDYYKSLNISIKDNKQTITADNKYFEAFKDIDCINSKKDLVDQLQNFKTVILSNTVCACEDILNLLYNLGMKKNQDFTLSFNTIENIFNENITIIINPHFGNLNIDSYQKIVFAGSFLCSDMFVDFLSKTPKEKCARYFLPHFTNSFQDLKIQRTDIACVYKYFTLPGLKKVSITDVKSCCKDIYNRFNNNMTSFKLLKVLEILDELQIIACRHSEKYNIILDIDLNSDKKELSSSTIFNFFSDLKIVGY